VVKFKYFPLGADKAQRFPTFICFMEGNAP
jgi:hypothetical protein